MTTDIDGSPILILTKEDAENIVQMHDMMFLDSDVRKTYEKVCKFLEECDETVHKDA